MTVLTSFFKIYVFDVMKKDRNHKVIDSSWYFGLHQRNKINILVEYNDSVNKLL